jgi:exonuclease SbcC
MQNIKKFQDLLIKNNLNKDYNLLLSEYKKESNDLKKIETEKEDLEEEIKQTQDFTALITKLQYDLKVFNDNLVEKEAKLGELEPTYNIYNEKTLLFGQIVEQQMIHEKNIGIKSMELKKVKENIVKIKEIEEKSKKEELELQDIKKQIEIHRILQKDIFHLNGVPKFAIEKILPAIATKASEILSDLTDGRINQIIFRPLEGNRVGFEIFVFDGEQERGASSYSGGEKTQINAAIRFAIMERIAELPDTTGAIFRKSNTLFIDEGDLGTLDDELSRKRFIDKIFELKSMFKKIILITHLEDVAEQFPNRIKIGRDESGKSKIF